MFQDPLFLLIAAVSVGVVIILLLGLKSFAKGGIDNAKNSNKFMRWRIIAQFIAVLLILLFVYIKQGT